MKIWVIVQTCCTEFISVHDSQESAEDAVRHLEAAQSARYNTRYEIWEDELHSLDQ